MSLICFRCFRMQNRVSDSREFQMIPSSAEGFHVLECTLAIAEDDIQPPAIVCRHEPESREYR